MHEHHKTKPVYQRIAELIQWEPQTIKSEDGRGSQLSEIESLLPKGSGIDCGTKIDLDESKPDKIVLFVEYHHINDNGYYDGWTAHNITIRPSLAKGFSLTISGKNRNDIKDYLYEVYDHTLNQTMAELVG